MNRKAIINCSIAIANLEFSFHISMLTYSLWCPMHC